MAEIMIFDHQFPFDISRETHTAQMKIVIVGLPQSDGTALKVRTSENRRYRQAALPEDFPFGVDIFQEEFKRSNPLLKATDDQVPFLAEKDLRQQVAKPGVPPVFRGQFKGNAEFAE